MSKQQKQAKSTPEIYHELNIDTAQRPNVCIMEDLNGNFSLHNNQKTLEKLQSFSALIKDTIQKIWPNFNEFLKENKNTILAYHANLFDAEPPKDQDIVITAMICWNKIIKYAKTDMTTQVPVSASGRKSTIELCEYRLGENKDPQLKTPQSQACYKLAKECIGSQDHVTEEILKQYIINHASELHTRQDPWRIFQYYRPILITNKLITRK